VNVNSLYLNDFSKQTKAEIKGDVKEVKIIDTTEAEESKYSKIKREQVKVEVESDDNFTKYAFVGLLKDDDFVKRYTAISKGLTQQQPDESYVKPKGKSKKKKEKSENLGIEKIAFVDPFYMRVKTKHGNDIVDFFESENRENFLADLQNKCADKLKLSHVNLSTKDLTSSDMIRYNDNALINEWLVERFKHGNTNEMVTSSEDLKKLIDKLGTKYIAWSGVFHSKTRSHHNTYFFMLFNLETGEALRYESKYSKGKDNKDLITSLTYNSLMHVTKKPK
jgi:hypothetical protein